MQRAGDEQRDPATHGGADENLRSICLCTNHCEAVFGPASNGSIVELAARFAVARVIEPQRRPAVCRSPGLEPCRLGGKHVRLEAAEPNDTGFPSFTSAASIREPTLGLALADLQKGGR